MLAPTLLDQGRHPDRATKRDRTLHDTFLQKNWKRRVEAEARPTPPPTDGAEPAFIARRDFAMKRAASSDPDLGVRLLERIIKGNDLVPVNYLERGAGCARAVCRIRLMDSLRQTVGFATGFMVARGVLLTNQHVFPTAEHARFARAEFGYEHDADGGDRVPETFEFNLHVRPIIRADFDFCLCAVYRQSVEGRAGLDEFGWLPLDPTPGKTRKNEYLTIIQHPAGERKQICVRENKLLKYMEHTVWYQTDTVAGSSGSPVFNNSWQVVALHHSGVPVTNAKGDILTTDGRVYDPAEMKENLIAWAGNEGIRVSTILACLREEHGEDQLARAVLAGAPSAAAAAATTRRVFIPGGAPSADGFGGASVTVPVFVGGGGGGGTRGGPAGFMRETPSGMPALEGPGGGGATGAGTFALEAAGNAIKKPAVGTIISFPSRSGDDLSDRKGYQPDFLGKDHLSVPEPKVAKNHAFNKAMTWGPGGKRMVLPYERHSVLVSEQRKFAIWAAVNVDDNARFTQPDGDPNWINDPRLGGRDVGDEFYKKSPGVKADGQGTRKSPFDRGHQVQQEDATWGKNATAAARASADTFYFPNSAPQIMKFNQGAKAWQGLEDYCIEVFAAKNGRACVFSGPIYDAPRSTGTSKLGTNALPIDPKGKRTPDPKFLGVLVPKAFYKIVVCSDGQRLRAAAFLMSQQLQLDALKGTPTVDLEETLTTAQAKIFFVKVSDVSALTGLDFGNNVRDAEGTTLEAARIGRGIKPGAEIRSLADLRL